MIWPFSGIVMLGLFVVRALAGPLPEVQIQAISDSKKSIIINRGTLEGIQVGMQAFFLKSLGPTTFQTVGNARVVKVSEHRSVWYFVQTVNPAHLRKEGFMNMLTQRESLSGRAPFKIVRHQRVRLPSQSSQGLLSHSPKKGQEMMRKGEKYEEVSLDLGGIKEDVRDDRHSIFDLGEWTERTGKMESGVEGQKVYVKLLKEGPKTEERRRSLKDRKHFGLIQHLENKDQRSLEKGPKVSTPALVDPLRRVIDRQGGEE